MTVVDCELGTTFKAGQSWVGAEALCARRRSRLDAVIHGTPLGWDSPTMIVTLDAKRRLTMPTSLAPASAGDDVDAHFDAEEVPRQPGRRAPAPPRARPPSQARIGLGARAAQPRR